MSAEAIKTRLKSIELFERAVVMRLPFRFGSVTVREAAQAFVRTEIETNGKRTIGGAADLMVPKWFDKSPELSNEDNAEQLRTALQIAANSYLSDRTPATIFGLHARHARPVKMAAERAKLPPLVASFGLALVDRALIDAFCRAEGLSFAQALRANHVGFQPHLIAPDLAELDTSAFLRSLTPSHDVAARHTVGLLDPLTAQDSTTRPNDDLPVTLEEIIAAYGNTYFKLKLCGDSAADVDRLSRIASILDERVATYKVTLDGNEQYGSIEEVIEFLAATVATRTLDRLRKSILFVEQPIARATAMDKPLGALGANTPVIIDESDADDAALPRALALGYRGTSSKACKGIWRSLINLARLRSAGDQGIMSGEDLTTQAGLALQQDLALVSLLGLGHVERNGHHYVYGFASTPAAEAEGFRWAHPDLYAAKTGRARLKIESGRIALETVNNARGLGSSVLPDFAAMEPMKHARIDIT